MSKDKYQALLAKYLNGECTDEERALLDQWYESLADAAHNTSETTNPIQKAAFLEKNWEALLAKTQANLPTSKGAGLWWRWFAAASVLLLAGAAYYWFQPTQEAKFNAEYTQGLESRLNSSAQTQIIALPDGSKVHLGSQARLVLDTHFGQQSRGVRLEGEAFFEIARNPKLPFLVRSGALVTEVLGTSFRIKPQADQKTIEVSVNTGRVSVYAQENPKTQKLNGVILTPNQKIIFDTGSKTIRQGIVDQPRMIASNLQAANFKFDESSLESVTNILQRAYGVEIVIVNPGIRQCAFTGDLNGLGLQDQLNFVCGSINAEFEIRGSSIFILGRACN